MARVSAMVTMSTRRATAARVSLVHLMARVRRTGAAAVIPTSTVATVQCFVMRRRVAAVMVVARRMVLVSAAATM